MSLKNERDSTIQKLYARHNLGSLPNTPFSDEGALGLINRTKSRLMDLEKDMEDKKVTFFRLGVYFVVGVYTCMFLNILF